MKILSLILKIIETGIVCIWGVAVGIFFPVFILVFGTDIVNEDIAGRTDIMILWLVTAIAGYIIPAALIFMKHYRIAAGMSVAGLAGVITLDVMFSELYKYTDGSTGPDELFLPLIFATILTILILAVEERKNIMKLLENRLPDKDAPAPSILGDNNDEKE